MAHVFTLGKKKWLAGLHWVTYFAPPRKEDLLEDADGLAQREKNPLTVEQVAIRFGKECIQAGYAEKGEESDRRLSFLSSKKCYSLAAMLADSQRQPWLGIFKMDEDQYWFVAVRDDNRILPQGDFVGTRDEVIAVRDRYTGLNDDWKYITHTCAELESMLQSIDSKPALVKPLVSNSIPWKPILVATVLVMIGIVSIWYAHQTKVTQRLKIQAAAIRQQQTLQQPTPAQLLAAEPRPSAWLQACRAVIYNLPLSQSGWDFDTVSCDGKQVIVLWKRALIGTLDARPPGVVNESGDVITQTLALKTTPNQQIEQTEASVPTLEAAILKLRAWAQAKNIDVTIETGQPAPLPGAMSEITQGETKHQRTVTFEFLSPFAFEPFESDLDLLPGFRAKKLSLAPSYTTTGHWIMQGMLYGS